ncbi:MAG: hypothetical protein ACRD0A_05645, partial [Acidimicrobiales bacterium]
DPTQRPALGGVRAAGRLATPAAEVAPEPPEPQMVSPVSPVSPAAPATVEPDMPTRDDLTLAWGDSILGGLPQPVRVRWAVGRFVGVDGAVARFALPNAIHRDRCDEQRPEVERALAEHFGRPLGIALTLDEDRPTVMPGPPPSTAEAGPAEDAIDLSELVDAPADPRRGIDVLSQHFPDALLLEEEDDQ